MKALDADDAAREALAVAAWKKVAGDALNQHTIAEALHGKKLVVAVRSETWRKYLEPLTGQMIFKLNSVLGQAVVTFVEFRVNERKIRRLRGVRKTDDDSEFEKLAEGLISEDMRRAAESIRDESLRASFLRAAGNCLVRKQRRLEKD